MVGFNACEGKGGPLLVSGLFLSFGLVSLTGFRNCVGYLLLLRMFPMVRSSSYFPYLVMEKVFMRFIK
jgi:hypothetical protein